MSVLFSIEQGSAVSRLVTVEDSDGMPVTTLLQTDTLSAEVSPGGGRPALFQPSVTWSDPASGEVSLSLEGADTALLEPGLYRLRAKVQIDAGWVYFLDGIFRVTGASGSAEALRTYCAMADVRRVAPWIDELLVVPDLGLSLDLLEQRHRAASRLEELLLLYYRPFDRRGFGRGGYGLGDPGSGSWGGLQAMQGYGNWPWLRTALEGGALMTAGVQGDRVREITARWTVAHATEGQIGEGPGKTSYQTMGELCLARANSLLSGYVAELDLDGDGFPDLWIDCGRRSVR